MPHVQQTIGGLKMEKLISISMSSNGPCDKCKKDKMTINNIYSCMDSKEPIFLCPDCLLEMVLSLEKHGISKSDLN